jgi:hypothetical protein
MTDVMFDGRWSSQGKSVVDCIIDLDIDQVAWHWIWGDYGQVTGIKFQHEADAIAFKLKVQYD